jgi:succinyl-diaminopimelate desuccinylase
MLPISDFLMELQEQLLNEETIYPIALDMPSKVGSVTISLIEGGTTPGAVPDKCFLSCLINSIPEMNLEGIKTKILNFVDKYKHNNPDIELSVQSPVFCEPLIADVNTEFAKIVKSAYRTVYNEERDFKAFLATTDAHHFKRNGIETLLLGTIRGSNNIHAQDEFVYVDDVINATKVYALTALNYLK